MRTGYSLASMFLLTAVAAVFLAGVRLFLADLRPLTDESGMAIALGMVGTIIAVAIGVNLGSARGHRGLGILGGFAFGALSTFLLVVPRQYLVIAVGAPLLIVFAAAVRRLSGRPAGQPGKGPGEQ